MAADRPDDCSCRHPDQGLPCFPCYLAGFREPNPDVDEREIRPLRPTPEYFARRGL